MLMKKVKKLLLILVAPLFTLLVSSALSITHDFNWQGIIVFVAVITALEMMLAIRSPNKLIDSIVGWMFCGAKSEDPKKRRKIFLPLLFLILVKSYFNSSGL